MSQQQLRGMAYDTAQYAMYEEECQYFKKMFAYDVLDSTNGAIANDTSGMLQSFYDSAKVEAMGKLKDVDKYIADSNYTAADAANNNVYPSNGVDANRKEVNRLYLLTLKDSSYHYTAADSAAIYAIAAQCPSEAGSAVWDARALYYSIIDDFIDFEDNCNAIGKSLTHPGNHPGATAPGNFRLYPNPNNGSMTIEYRLGDNENADISIYDIAGRKVKTYLVSSKNTMLKISENELDAGTYYYNIRVNNKTVKTEKLVIIK